VYQGGQTALYFGKRRFILGKEHRGESKEGTQRKGAGRVTSEVPQLYLKKPAIQREGPEAKGGSKKGNLK